MKIFECLLCGDEFFSDSFKYNTIYNDAAYEVQAKYKKKGLDQVAIASDDIIEENEADMVTVVDLVDNHQLSEINLGKKDFMGYVKTFLAAVTAKLEAKGKQDRVPEFKKGATELVKFIVSKYDEFQIYTGK
jgi:hypothetical protein